MKRLYVLLTLLGVGTVASAGMAQQAHRSKDADIDLVTYRTNVKDVVVLIGALPGGDAMAGGNIAVPTLSGMMLDRGTKALDKFAISEKLNEVGAEIGFEVGTQALQIHAKFLNKDLKLVMGLLAADLRTPALGLAEFNKAKEQFIGALQASAQNTGARASEAFDRGIFPEGHPNRPHTVSEYIAAAKVATLDDVKSFQSKYYGPAHLTMVIAGDVSDVDVQAEIAADFAGWSGGQDYIRSTALAALAAAQEVSVPLLDKPSVSVILGAPTGLKYSDPDALALRVGTAVLGQGFTGRLMGSVRDKEGLTYGISASVGDDTLVDGAWDISASFAPQLLTKGIASTRRELERWYKDGITEAELTARKQGIIGSYQVGLSTTAGVAGTILTDIQRGFDLTWLDKYPQAVNALTVAQVNAAIKSHLNPSAMLLVKAGSVAQVPK